MHFGSFIHESQFGGEHKPHLENEGSLAVGTQEGHQGQGRSIFSWPLSLSETEARLLGLGSRVRSR